MSPMSSIITSTVPSSFVSRRKLPPKIIPDSGYRLSVPSAPIRKCMFPSDNQVRDPTPVQCPAAAAQKDWTVSSISDDAGAVAAGKHKMGLFQGRSWTARETLTVGVVIAMHGLSLLAPFYYTWCALWVAVGLYVVTGLFGITLSYHRNLSHRSFKVPKWLEYTFAYCGVLALRRDPIDWVSTHRYHHHMYSDSDRDPHSPIQGFWFSHITWLFDQSLVLHKCGGQTNAVDLQRQPFYRFLQKTYLVHPLGLGLLLYSLGGLPFLVWGMGARTVWLYRITWFVGSTLHVRGNQAWNTEDMSRNNWLLGMLGFGEGWHNHHHAFEYSARQGLEWWQVDMTWYVIKFLQAIGVATDVKLPSEADKQRLAFN